MNVLVTGSSGYLASLVLPRLAADPGVKNLIGLDVRPPRIPNSRVRHFSGDVLDPELRSLLERERTDLVLHLAWVFNPTHDREAMRRIDVDGTRNVLEAAYAARVQHVVYLGSTTAYGAHATNPPRLKESAPTPGSSFPYAADKAAVEVWLDRFAHEHPDLSLTRVRSCIVLGKRVDNFVRAILDLAVLFQIRGHDPEMQFLHEDDLADCLALIVARRPRGVFNIAPEDTIKLTEIGTALGKRVVALPAGLLYPMVRALWATHLFMTPASYLDFVRWPWLADVTRMREVLGFTPCHGSRAALAAMRERSLARHL